MATTKAKARPKTKAGTTPAEGHRWAFKARFRRAGFGWKSQPAITRLREAVAEIEKVAKADPTLAAEGVIVLIERLSPALEQVDSSSGAIGNAVNRAIAKLVCLVASAPVEEATREDWLERLWDAYQADEVPYIESLGDHWGELCGSPALASRWADRLLGTCKLAWSPDASERGFFSGTTNCLSALFAAGRYDDILALLELAPYRLWHDTQYGTRALAALGRVDEALRYAHDGAGRMDNEVGVASVCEEILRTAGRVDEAYARYGLIAHTGGTYLATFRAVAKRYPHKRPDEILSDLVQTTPGDEGKWFAAAKDAGLFDEALALASRTPCDPKTLARAARDHADAQPAFAVAAGLLALRWLVAGYGYEITGLDVWQMYRSTIAAAERQGDAAVVRGQIRELVAAEPAGERFVTKILGRELGL